jgi:phosphoribosylamine--glycine ligase
VRVLVVGSGGREHALAWKIARSPEVDRVLVAPGNSGMEAEAVCFPDVSAADLDGVVALAQRESVGLVVVGPEDPLAAGLVDRLQAAGIEAFGPSQAAARLEASKSFAKDFMRRHDIPTARYESFDDLDAALAYVRDLGGRCVVKADGLAAGKGVAMCEDVDAASRALTEMMADGRFGDAGARVVIEEWMDGEEASYHVISDGTRCVALASSQDHKRALDGDRGENTGGMGAYSPAPVVTEAIEKRVLEEIVHPTIRGMTADGAPYRGVLYVGLMIDASGPRVVEFNVRLGDPETQPLMVRMESDLVPLLLGSARGSLDESTAVAWGDAAVCVAMASGGYPRGYEVGKAISGVEQALGDENVAIFHAGTRRRADGTLETAGGRVLGVTARGESIREARDRAYAAAGRIDFEGVTLRTDIAQRALDR